MGCAFATGTNSRCPGQRQKARRVTILASTNGCHTSGVGTHTRVVATRGSAYSIYRGGSFLSPFNTQETYGPIQFPIFCARCRSPRPSSGSRVGASYISFGRLPCSPGGRRVYDEGAIGLGQSRLAGLPLSPCGEGLSAAPFLCDRCGGSITRHQDGVLAWSSALGLTQIVHSRERDPLYETRVPLESFLSAPFSVLVNLRRYPKQTERNIREIIELMAKREREAGRREMI
jgi:hypothetical protein